MHICGGAHSSLSLTSSRDLSSVNWDSDSSRDFSAFVLTRVAATVYKDNNILEFQSVSSVLKTGQGPRRACCASSKCTLKQKLACKFEWVQYLVLHIFSSYDIITLKVKLFPFRFVQFKNPHFWLNGRQ